MLRSVLEDGSPRHVMLRMSEPRKLPMVTPLLPNKGLLLDDSTLYTQPNMCRNLAKECLQKVVLRVW